MKTTNCLISIIVPVYNVEKYLSQCIDSILAQTFTDFELILVNDGSTDNSGKICDDYALQDNRIKVIHKKNGGLSDARNAGIDIANGKYLMFVDSDDYVDKDYAKVLYDNIIQTNADMVICGFYWHCDDNKIVYGNSSITADEIVDNTTLYRRMTRDDGWQYVMAVNKIYKRELFANIRYPIGKLHEDTFVAHHLFHECKSISIITTPLYFYRKRENSITQTPMDLKRLINCFEAESDRFYFYKKHKIKDLQNFYMRSVYSRTLQIIAMADTPPKEILHQSFLVLKFNPRMLVCMFHYYKKFLYRNNHSCLK